MQIHHLDDGCILDRFRFLEVPKCNLSYLYLDARSNEVK